MKSNLLNRRKINKFSSTMGIRYWALGMLALWGSFGVAQASPLTMQFTPSTKTVTVGESFVVDFSIIGLDQSDIISAFDVDIVFEHTLLEITAISFGTQLGVDTDQTSGFDYTTTPGIADIFQFSQLLDADLKGLQPGNMVSLVQQTGSS